MVKKMARENRVKKTKKFTKRMKVKQMIVFFVLIIVLGLTIFNIVVNLI